jgi:hypothetical protein
MYALKAAKKWERDVYKQGSHVCTRAAFLSARIRLGGWVSIRKNTPERIYEQGNFIMMLLERHVFRYTLYRRAQPSSLLLAREAPRVCCIYANISELKLLRSLAKFSTSFPALPACLLALSLVIA